MVIKRYNSLNSNRFNVPVEEIEEQKEYMKLVRTVIDSRFHGKAPKAFVHTYGCQGNVSDGEKLQGMLFEMGYEFTNDVKKADLVLYNTCAIREHAEDRIYGNVGALKQYKKTNPNLIIALCGCMMQQERVAEKIRNSYPFVDLLLALTYHINCLNSFSDVFPQVKECSTLKTLTATLQKVFPLNVTAPSKPGYP